MKHQVDVNFKIGDSMQKFPYKRNIRTLCGVEVLKK